MISSAAKAVQSTGYEIPPAKSAVLTGKVAAAPRVSAKATVASKDERAAAKSTDRVRQLVEKESSSGLSDVAALKIAASYSPVSATAPGGAGVPKAPPAPDRAGDRSPVAISTPAKADGRRRDDGEAV